MAGVAAVVVSILMLVGRDDVVEGVYEEECCCCCCVLPPALERLSLRASRRVCFLACSHACHWYSSMNTVEWSMPARCDRMSAGPWDGSAGGSCDTAKSVFVVLSTKT